MNKVKKFLNFAPKTEFFSHIFMIDYLFAQVAHGTITPEMRNWYHGLNIVANPL
jgi:hypothetical protein